MQSPARPALLRYGGTIAAALLATFARLALDPVLGDLFPFATLFFAVLIVAGYGGRGPALLATGLGALALGTLPPAASGQLRPSGGSRIRPGCCSTSSSAGGSPCSAGRCGTHRKRARGDADEAARQREQLRTTVARAPAWS